MTTPQPAAHYVEIPCVDCGHSHLDHAVDDEELRHCVVCPCVQYRCADAPTAEASSP